MQEIAIPAPGVLQLTKRILSILQTSYRPRPRSRCERCPVAAPVRYRLQYVEDRVGALGIAQVVGFHAASRIVAQTGGAARARVEFAPYSRPERSERWIPERRIQVLADTPSARWLERMIDDPVCEVSAPRNSLDLVLAGKGIVRLPTFIGDAQTSLRRAGDPIAELAHDQWIVAHQDDRHLPEIRRMMDRLYGLFRTRPR